MIALLAAAYAAPSAAQSLSPMTDTVVTYQDVFALQLKARNPYATPQRFFIRVLNDDGSAARARALPPVLTLPPGETASFFVWGDSVQQEKVMVCATSEPFSTGAGTLVKGEVCGKYAIIRRQL